MSNEHKARPRIGYMCSYVPVNLLRKCGLDMVNLYDFCKANGSINRLPVNLCGYSLHCAQIICEAQLNGIIVTNCCNSMQRLFDYIILTKPDIFCYMLELPRDDNYYETSYFGEQVKDLINKIKNCFVLEQDILMDQDNCIIEQSEIYVLGSAISADIRERLGFYLENYDIFINHCGVKGNGDLLIQRYLTNGTYGGMEYPCARMNYFTYWFKNCLNENSRLKGVVYLSTQNCDNHLFNFPMVKALCAANRIPVIGLEMDYGAKSLGQFATRMEAFVECITMISPSG